MHCNRSNEVVFICTHTLVDNLTCFLHLITLETTLFKNYFTMCFLHSITITLETNAFQKLFHLAQMKINKNLLI